MGLLAAEHLCRAGKGLGVFISLFPLHGTFLFPLQSSAPSEWPLITAIAGVSMMLHTCNYSLILTSRRHYEVWIIVAILQLRKLRVKWYACFLRSPPEVTEQTSTPVWSFSWQALPTRPHCLPWPKVLAKKIPHTGKTKYLNIVHSETQHWDMEKYS